MKLTHCIVLVLTAGAAMAAPQQFDFKDPKGVNNAVFQLDAPLESINGSASGISGSVTFDPAKPAGTSGRIIVASASLHVPNPLMKNHLHSDKWLDVAKSPEISFELKELRDAKTEREVTTATAVGIFTLKGVSKEIVVPVKLTYLKDKLQARVPNQQGDLLVIRSRFGIKRSDFNIMPGQHEDKVSDDIDISLSIAGASPR